MNKNSFSQWLTTGIVGLGALTVLAGTIAPAAAQGYHPWDNSRSSNGGYNNNGNGRYGSGGWNNSGSGNGRNGYNNGGYNNGGQNTRTNWSDIDRKPDFNTDSRPGLYVWRDRDDVFVVANAPNRGRPSRYSGEITVHNGSISNVGGYQTERGDRVQQVASDRVTFAFMTRDGLDGVRFHVKDSDRIVITVQQDGRSMDRVYLGQNKYEVRTDRLVIQK